MLSRILAGWRWLFPPRDVHVSRSWLERITAEQEREAQLWPETGKWGRREPEPATKPTRAFREEVQR